MGPLENIFLSIGVMIVLVALVRGYKYELGNTLILQVLVFLIAQFNAQFDQVLRWIGVQIFGIGDDRINLFLFISLALLFSTVVLASYWGRTFDFAGTGWSGPSGMLISVGIGILNAYLICGTLWYFLDKYNYPLQQLGIITLPLTTFAQNFVANLPPILFERPYYWIIPAALLVLARVWG